VAAMGIMHAHTTKTKIKKCVSSTKNIRLKYGVMSDDIVRELIFGSNGFKKLKMKWQRKLV